jgi:hypothetical protein
MIASERLCRTVDGRIVSESDAEAAFLVVGAGAEVPAEYQDAVAVFVAAAVKQVEQPANKAVEAPDADKAAPVKKAPARRSKS